MSIPIGTYDGDPPPENIPFRTGVPEYTVPLYEFEPCVDYHILEKIVEEKYNVRLDDFAGSHSKEARKEKKEAELKWLNENGYADKEYVLDVPNKQEQDKPYKDWPKDSPEMALRIEINTKLRNVVLVPDRPYQNYWHRVCDDINRGGVNYIYLEEHEDNEEWVNKIHKMIKSVLVGNPAYDAEEELVRCHIDW